MALLKKIENTPNDRRKEVRRRLVWGSWLAHLDGGHFVKCEIRDISPEGARIRMESGLFHAKSAYLLVMRDRIAYESKVIWHNAPEIGLQFVRAYRFDEIPSQQIWKIIEDQYRSSSEWLAK